MRTKRNTAKPKIILCPRCGRELQAEGECPTCAARADFVIPRPSQLERRPVPDLDPAPTSKSAPLEDAAAPIPNPVPSRQGARHTALDLHDGSQRRVLKSSIRFQAHPADASGDGVQTRLALGWQAASRPVAADLGASGAQTDTEVPRAFSLNWQRGLIILVVGTICGVLIPFVTGLF